MSLSNSPSRLRVVVIKQISARGRADFIEDCRFSSAKKKRLSVLIPRRPEIMQWKIKLIGHWCIVAARGGRATNTLFEHEFSESR
jgi:hypothetical protein